MQPVIRTGLLSNFRPTITALGADPDAVVSAAGGSWEVISNPDAFIPYPLYFSLLSTAAEHTGCPHFGLEMSRALGAADMGVSGFIMTQAETVGEAWRTFSRFYHVHDTYGTVGLHSRGDLAYVTYTLPDNSLRGVRESSDMAVGIAHNINLMFCGPGFETQVLQLPYPEPADLEPFARFGARRLLFDQPSYAVGFDVRLLDQAIAQTDPRLKAILADYVRSLEKSGEHMYSRQVEQLIRQFLSTGRCTVVHIARFLSVSVRTLQNRLEAEHTSFQALLEKVRRDLALKHLAGGDLQLTQVAFLLGYSELSAFSRSFKRWYGRSPRQWQQQADRI